MAKKKLTDKQKLKEAVRVLRTYANSDMWFNGSGHPIRNNERYGQEEGKKFTASNMKYNVLGIFPAQDGWHLAQDALAKIG